MLLFFAFVCFALLFAGWIIAPSTSQGSEPVKIPERSDAIVEPGTSPA